jgi:flavin reductase (DIM6/NTAB) family NADH-FMN oxidoreductase RutF
MISKNSIPDVPMQASQSSVDAELPASEFRRAMRELAGAVSVVTVGIAPDRTGFVATSVSSFSSQPPRLIICMDRTSSSSKALSKYGRFGVNFMRDTDAVIADRFAGFGGEKGEERYAGAEWVTLATGTQVLRYALASIDCTVEETLDRHDHTIVLGKVESIRICEEGRPLLWFQAKYHGLGDPLKSKLP